MGIKRQLPQPGSDRGRFQDDKPALFVLPLMTSFRENESFVALAVFVYDSFPTGSDLKGGDGLLQAGDGLAITSGPDLRVQGSHVEEDTGLLQRQVLLAHWHPSEGVIPEGNRWRLTLGTTKAKTTRTKASASRCCKHKLHVLELHSESKPSLDLKEFMPLS